MYKEVDSFDVLRLRMKSLVKFLDNISNSLAETSQLAPNEFKEQPVLAAASIDLRDVQRRLRELLTRIPNDDRRSPDQCEQSNPTALPESSL